MNCWTTPNLLPGLLSLTLSFLGTLLLRGSSRRLQDVPHIGPGTPMWGPTHAHQHRNRETLSRLLLHKTRILCLVFTHPENHLTRAVHVSTTWGQRCNGLYFMTTQTENVIPTVSLPISEGRNYLWNKTKESYKWAYENHLHDYDWFFKADDDTYAIMENMRYLLSFYNPDEPWYFGSRFKKYSRKGYMSGGGGYILSRASVKMFVETGLQDPAVCEDRPQGSEDAEMGKCMSAMNVSYGDTRDRLHRWRFFPLDMLIFFDKDRLEDLDWFWDYIYFNITLSMECCSDTAVTYHYECPHRMYFYDFMLYHLRARTTSTSVLHLPKTLFNISDTPL